MPAKMHPHTQKPPEAIEKFLIEFVAGVKVFCFLKSTKRASWIGPIAVWTDLFVFHVHARTQTFGLVFVHTLTRAPFVECARTARVHVHACFMYTRALLQYCLLLCVAKVLT